MKTLILTAALGVVCVSASAQGTLNFANAGVGWSAVVTDSNGIGLTGIGWNADLFWAAGAVTDSTQLFALGAPATFSTVPSEAGLFFGGTRTVPTAPGIITAQVRVWNAAAGSSWTQAEATPGSISGESRLFLVTLANSNATPTSMTNLSGFQVTVNCLDCPPPPILQPPVAIYLTTNALVLVWPINGQSPLFLVQQNTDLNTTNWVTLTNLPVLVTKDTNLYYQTSVTRPNTTTFYRLTN